MSVNVRAAIENQLEMIRDFENDEHTLDTPYTTFHHRDMHMKNILVKRGMSIGCILFVADTFLYAILYWVHSSELFPIFCVCYCIS